MTVDKIDVSAAIENAKELLVKNKDLDPTIKTCMQLMITIILLLVNKLGLNSQNSSIPPSKDPLNKKKRKPRKVKGQKRKPGGQLGRNGSTLEKVDDPDEIESIDIDLRTIPKGDYKEIGFESRQVFNVEISMNVTEYRAQILEDENGNQYVADFPEGVNKAAQYGSGVKAHSTYMTVGQLIPLERARLYFNDQIGLPVSKGSIYNFNLEAFERLTDFEVWAIKQLIKSKLVHADETGINLNGKNIWLHCLSSESVTLFHADEKRGKEAMDRMGVLPNFTGFLVHDHWKPYYNFKCDHCLCNAHHLRELERAWEQDGQKWAKLLKKLLEEINEAVKNAGGVLAKEAIERYKKRFRSILKRGESECPLVEKKNGKRGRQAQSKSRNLLKRLCEYEGDVLRFMEIEIVPFTNNQGENDIRMTKVQQKISGCFRSKKGADIFCRIRSFLLTCQKNGVCQTDALQDLYDGKLPDFMK